MFAKYQLLRTEPLEIVRRGPPISPTTFVLGLTALAAAVAIGLLYLDGEEPPEPLLVAVFVGLAGTASAAMAGAFAGHGTVFISQVRRIHVVDTDGAKCLAFDGLRVPVDSISRVQIAHRVVIHQDSTATHNVYIVVIPFGDRGVELRAADSEHAVELAVAIGDAIGREPELEPFSQGAFGLEYIWSALVLCGIIFGAVGLLMLPSIQRWDATSAWILTGLTVVAAYSIMRSVSRWAATKNVAKRMGTSEPRS